jgi:O-methyltransferase involved in polyketide biosynthesis
VVRTGDDSWDLASSVGATATMVAAARAIASRDERRLIDDPFAPGQHHGRRDALPGA